LLVGLDGYAEPTKAFTDASTGIASISGLMHKYLDGVAMHFENYALI
jgi:hypothetical protein